MKQLTGIYLEFDNKEKINIQNLDKKDYEQFLNRMNELRMAYISIVSRQNKTDKNEI